MRVSERGALGLALAGHALLFGLLSLGVLDRPPEVKIESKPIEVSLAPDIKLETAAPAPAEPPAQSQAPDLGPPEDAAPPAPQPAPAPAPAPKPTAPAPRPEPPSPAPPKPQPTPKPVAKAPPPPRKPAPATTPARAVAQAPARPAAPAAKPAPQIAKGTGADPRAARPRATGSRLGDDFLKGLSDQPSPSRSAEPVAAQVAPFPSASIKAAIERQIQPCADRQVDPGPGANQIVTILNLRLNPDGTLAATPTMVRQSGIDDDNERYARRVVDLGVAALKGCSPLHLPSEYYRTGSGGWSNLNYTWKLR